jgi:hypothetical protein
VVHEAPHVRLLDGGNRHAAEQRLDLDVDIAAVAADRARLLRLAADQDSGQRRHIQIAQLGDSQGSFPFIAGKRRVVPEPEGLAERARFCSGIINPEVAAPAPTESQHALLAAACAVPLDGAPVFEHEEDRAAFNPTPRAEAGNLSVP